MLHECTNGFKAMPEIAELQTITKDLCACGIGLGTSASEAEFNAVVALRQGKDFGFGSWFVVSEDKKSIGPLGYESLEEVELYSERLTEHSKKTGLSIVTLGKIAKIIEKNNNELISAQELAVEMHILPRSARRILQQLAEGGVAKEVGMEAPGMKGRPKKVYKIII